MKLEHNDEHGYYYRSIGMIEREVLLVAKTDLIHHCCVFSAKFSRFYLSLLKKHLDLSARHKVVLWVLKKLKDKSDPLMYN